MTQPTAPNSRAFAVRRFGSGGWMLSQRLRNNGSIPAASSSTGIRGTFTIPDSMASISEKSLTTHGKMKPSL